MWWIGALIITLIKLKYLTAKWTSDGLENQPVFDEVTTKLIVFFFDSQCIIYLLIIMTIYV